MRVLLLLTRAEPKAPAQPARQPAPTPAPQPERQEQEKRADRARQEEFTAVQDLPAVHFDFDKAAIRSDAADALVGYAGWLKDHDDTAPLIEGHCDERGTPEYNVALGDRRAKAVKDYLATYGVGPDRISTVSYGKERPACAAATEACREENRRAEFRVKSR